mmetsp:Transcript_13946/g.32907  ORF Transcript_13946/g.32907 Transcript_13946/m.32907 type:complete len:93 (+) Transcript_13946:69-347(+)
MVVVVVWDDVVGVVEDDVLGLDEAVVVVVVELEMVVLGLEHALEHVGAYIHETKTPPTKLSASQQNISNTLSSDVMLDVFHPEMSATKLLAL